MPDTTEKKIRVMLVDDHAIVRQGLRTLLELMPDIEIAGEAENGRRAVELVPSLRPDVVMMDIKMPEMDGIAATKEICQLGLGTKVIALTSFLEDKNVIPAIQAGATSFLLKDVMPNELIETIRLAYRGEARLHPSVAQRLMEEVTARPAVVQSNLPEITDRELDVIKLIAKGKSNRDIAEDLVLSEKTVKTHVSNLLGKLELNDRTQLAIYAIKNHLVDEQAN